MGNLPLMYCCVPGQVVCSLSNPVVVPSGKNVAVFITESPVTPVVSLTGWRLPLVERVVCLRAKALGSCGPLLRGLMETPPLWHVTIWTWSLFMYMCVTDFRSCEGSSRRQGQQQPPYSVHSGQLSVSHSASTSSDLLNIMSQNHCLKTTKSSQTSSFHTSRLIIDNWWISLLLSQLTLSPNLLL